MSDGTLQRLLYNEWSDRAAPRAGESQEASSRIPLRSWAMATSMRGLVSCANVHLPPFFFCTSPVCLPRQPVGGSPSVHSPTQLSTIRKMKSPRPQRRGHWQPTSESARIRSTSLQFTHRSTLHCRRSVLYALSRSTDHGTATTTAIVPRFPAWP